MDEDEDLNADPGEGGEKQEDEAPASGSQQETVPKHQFLAAIKSANDKYDALARDFQELKAKTSAAPAPQPTNEPTRAELLAAVKDGLISQEQADAVWGQQITAKAIAQATAATKQTASLAALEQRVNAELTSYRDLVPEAWVDGTPERKKVEAEYKHLVSLGHPSTIATEAAAMRAAFGDTAALKLAKGAKPGSKDGQHQESGGSKGERPGDTKADPVKGLDARQKEYYSEGIKRGRYKDWDAVREELKFARKRA